MGRYTLSIHSGRVGEDSGHGSGGRDLPEGSLSNAPYLGFVPALSIQDGLCVLSGLMKAIPNTPF